MNNKQAIEKILIFISDMIHNSDVNNDDTELITFAEMIEHGTLHENIDNWIIAKGDNK